MKIISLLSTSSSPEPQNWPNLYDSCRGSFQSPINIITSKVEYGCHLKPFIFENYTPKNQATWTVENNGHTGKKRHQLPPAENPPALWKYGVAAWQDLSQERGACKNHCTLGQHTTYYYVIITTTTTTTLQRAQDTCYPCCILLTSVTLWNGWERGICPIALSSDAQHFLSGIPRFTLSKNLGPTMMSKASCDPDVIVISHKGWDHNWLCPPAAMSQFSWVGLGWAGQGQVRGFG